MKNFTQISKILKFSVILFTIGLLLNCQPKSNNNSTTGNEEIDSTVTDIIPIKPHRDSLIINRDTMEIEDTENPSDHEFMHTPEITIGEKDEKAYAIVNVKIGSNDIEHPSDEYHWVDFIELDVDGKLFSRKEFENGPNSNKTTFFAPFESTKKIKIVFGCNLHGIWSKEIEIR